MILTFACANASYPNGTYNPYHDPKYFSFVSDNNGAFYRGAGTIVYNILHTIDCLVIEATYTRGSSTYSGIVSVTFSSNKSYINDDRYGSNMVYSGFVADKMHLNKGDTMTVNFGAINAFHVILGDRSNLIKTPVTTSWTPSSWG